MKATGIVRRVDDLGRVVIPIELRRTLGIGEKDSLEIFVEEDSVILRKYRKDTEKAEMIAKLESVVVDNPDVKEVLDEAREFIQKKA